MVQGLTLGNRIHFSRALVPAHLPFGCVAHRDSCAVVRLGLRAATGFAIWGLL